MKKPEYIIRHKNGNILYHGHSSRYAWQKFDFLWKMHGRMCMKRRDMENFYLLRHDGKEYQLGAFGRHGVGGEHTDVELVLIAH